MDADASEELEKVPSQTRHAFACVAQGLGFRFYTGFGC